MQKKMKRQVFVTDIKSIKLLMGSMQEARGRQKQEGHTDLKKPISVDKAARRFHSVMSCME